MRDRLNEHCGEGETHTQRCARAFETRTVVAGRVSDDACTRSTDQCVVFSGENASNRSSLEKRKKKKKIPWFCNVHPSHNRSIYCNPLRRRLSSSYI